MAGSYLGNIMLSGTHVPVDVVNARIDRPVSLLLGIYF